MGSLTKPMSGCCGCLALIGAGILLLAMLSGGVKSYNRGQNLNTSGRITLTTDVDADQKRLYWVDASTRWSKVAAVDVDKMIKGSQEVAARDGLSAGESYFAKQLDNLAAINLEASKKLQHVKPPPTYVQLNKSMLDALATNATFLRKYAIALRTHNQPAIDKAAKALSATQGKFGQLMVQMNAKAAEAGVKLQ